MGAALPPRPPHLLFFVGRGGARSFLLLGNQGKSPAQATPRRDINPRLVCLRCGRAHRQADRACDWRSRWRRRRRLVRGGSGGPTRATPQGRPSLPLRWAPPTVRGGPAIRWLSLLVGLLLFAIGIVMLLESRLGLSPWDVLNQGIARHTPLSFGIANTVAAIVVLALAWRLGAVIGPGTVANAVLIGVFVDLLIRSRAFAGIHGAGVVERVLALAGGILMIGVASALYIGGRLR